MYTGRTLWAIKLIGLTKDGTKANTRQAKEVVFFVDSARTCRCTYGDKDRDSIIMETRDRRVLFTRHRKFNYYKAEINGKELRVDLRKTTGKLKCLKKVALPDDVVERLMAEGYYGGSD